MPLPEGTATTFAPLQTITETEAEELRQLFTQCKLQDSNDEADTWGLFMPEYDRVMSFITKKGAKEDDVLSDFKFALTHFPQFYIKKPKCPECRHTLKEYRRHRQYCPGCKRRYKFKPDDVIDVQDNPYHVASDK
jgi:hypothetical protein